MSPELRRHIEKLKARGLAIQAVALVRREQGSSLAEAKAIVDAVDVEVRLPEASTIWMTPSRQGFFAIPEDATPLLGEWQREELRTFLDVGEVTLAVEMMADWLVDSDEPLPESLAALASDALVACGREPLDDAD